MRTKKKLIISILASLVLASFICLMRAFATPVNVNEAKKAAEFFLKAQKIRWQQNPKLTPQTVGFKNISATSTHELFSCGKVEEIKGDEQETLAYIYKS